MYSYWKLKKPKAHVLSTGTSTVLLKRRNSIQFFEKSNHCCSSVSTAAKWTPKSMKKRGLIFLLLLGLYGLPNPSISFVNSNWSAISVKRYACCLEVPAGRVVGQRTNFVLRAARFADEACTPQASFAHPVVINALHNVMVSAEFVRCGFFRGSACKRLGRCVRPSTRHCKFPKSLSLSDFCSTSLEVGIVI